MEAVSKSLSLAERLEAGKAQAQAQEGEFVGTIQMAGGYLTIYYRVLSYREDRAIAIRHEAIGNQLERESRLAADTLASASVRSEAHVEEHSEELPKLGLELAARLGLDGPENDIQAVLALFPSERAMVEQFAELETWAKDVTRSVDRKLAEGDSLAATA